MSPCRRKAPPLLASASTAVLALATSAALGAVEPLPVVQQGEPVRVLDTRAFRGAPHYINDHTLIRGPDGRLHLFGIFHAEPYAGEEERVFVHAISRGASLAGISFEIADPPFALEQQSLLGETHLWAPHVVAHEGRYQMFFQSGGPDGDHARIRVAESSDIGRWVRPTAAPLFEDFCVARDPMVRKTGPLWIMYYTRCDARSSRKSGVAYRVSADLRRWSEPSMALVVESAPSSGDSGYTESPFVFERDGWYYLSVTAYPVAWDATFLYRSRSPLYFEEPPVARLRAHAPEWITEARTGELYMTHAGPGQGGVWLMTVKGL